MSLSSATLFVDEPGSSVGISKNRFVVKKQRKILLSIPQNHCERVIIAAGSISMSSDFVAVCAELGIGIDFLDRSLKEPLAHLSTPNQAYAKMTQRQLMLQDTTKQLDLAKAFLKAKGKNQINYLRYLDKHHNLFAPTIIQMRHLHHHMIEKANSTQELMGFEGQISHLYWQGLAKMLEGKVDFSNRHTKGATDVVNVSLNYAYGILYGRIHYHALKAGLSLHIPFLHSGDGKRPALVYDMIEEFRTFVVDRVIFRMFNQREPLDTDEDGRLTPFSQRRIASEVIRRLNTHTKYQNNSVMIENIISRQSYLLARAIKGVAKYRGFVGRY